MMFCQRKNGSVRKIWAVLILLMGCAVLLAGCGKGNIAQEKAERRAKFDAKMEEFGTNFSYKDYKEIIGIDRTQLMAVPQEATQIDPKAERYYDRQKSVCVPQRRGGRVYPAGNFGFGQQKQRVVAQYDFSARCI